MTNNISTPNSNLKVGDMVKLTNPTKFYLDADHKTRTTFEPDCEYVMIAGYEEGREKPYRLQITDSDWFTYASLDEFEATSSQQDAEQEYFDDDSEDDQDMYGNDFPDTDDFDSTGRRYGSAH